MLMYVGSKAQSAYGAALTTHSSNTARAFKLRGKIYRLSRTDVERAAAKAEPRPTEKYAVKVGERSFPPKQLIEVSLKLPPTSFTTLDASRILRKLGFEVLTSERETSERALQRWQHSPVQAPRSDVNGPSDQGWADLLLEPERGDRLLRVKTWLRETVLGTRAKDLFEAYLLGSRLDALKVERQPQEFGGLVDFIVQLRGKRMAFEVGEVSPFDFDIGSEVELYDPNRPVRERTARAEFDLRNVNEASRCAVLYNRCLSWPILDWRFMYESTFGGSEIVRGSSALAQNERGQQQPRRLDAVVVIDRLRTGYLRFQAQIAEQESKLKRTMPPGDYALELYRARGTERDILLSRLRVIVHKNPNASNPLPNEIFRGPYDEWYGIQDDGQIGRTFAGSEILSLEREGLPRHAQ